jgi:glycine/D-amino acid oxidase-like deaminating enzyme
VPSLEKVRAKTDVAIVGAGLTGLSAARELAKRGARVVVIEAQQAGWGASSRNGGMLLTGLKLGPHELVSKFGLERARALDAVSLAAIDHVERVINEESIDCEFTRCGHLALASKPAHQAQFARDVALINSQFGRAVRLIPRQELGAEMDSPVYFGALLDEASAGVNPAKLVHGLARAAARAGAVFVEHAPVRHIERRAHASARFALQTDHGTIEAEQIIVATGAYTSAESAWLQRRIVPIGSYVIATEPLPEPVAAKLAPRYRMMFDSKHFLHYFRLTSDRRMLFGGRASFIPESDRATAESAAVLRRDMATIFPQLKDARVDYAWGGTIDFTADMLPHAGEIDGIYYAAGYAGHGVALATLLGAQIGARISGANVDSPFMDSSFPLPALGAHRVFPGLVSAAGAWYRFLDLVS